MYKNRNKKQEDMTAEVSKYPNGYFKIKKCKQCLLDFQPKAPSHHFCSQKCCDTNASNKYLKRTYGISLEDFNNMLSSQNNLCAICKKEGFKINKNTALNLVVDHCHVTGVVRGLLCHNCNRALGLFKDNIESLNTAILYLEKCRD